MDETACSSNSADRISRLRSGERDLFHNRSLVRRRFAERRWFILLF